MINQIGFCKIILNHIFHKVKLYAIRTGKCLINILIEHFPHLITHFPHLIIHSTRLIAHFTHLITHFPRLIIHFPLLIAHFPRPITHFPLLIIHFPLLIAHFSQFNGFLLLPKLHLGRFLSQKLCFSYKSLRKNIKHSLEKIFLPKCNLGRRNEDNLPSQVQMGRRRKDNLPSQVQLGKEKYKIGKCR